MARWINNAITGLFLAAIVLVAWTGCKKAYSDPPLYTYPSLTMVRMSAELHARDLGGKALVVAATGSMEPTLMAGDFIVVTKPPFPSIEEGDILIYKAEWSLSGAPVCHRAVQKDRRGWIMSGDNNRHSEPHWRVTEDNYMGLVEARYRLKP